MQNKYIINPQKHPVHTRFRPVQKQNAQLHLPVLLALKPQHCTANWGSSTKKNHDTSGRM